MSLYIVKNGSTVICADDRWSAWKIAVNILNISNPILMRLNKK